MRGCGKNQAANRLLPFDVMVLKGTGKEACVEIKCLRPRIKVLF